MKTAIDLQTLSFGHGSPLINSLSLTLNYGELVSLVGRNGCGKSTLLKTITGVLPPIEGNVLIEGKCIQELHSKDLAKRISIVTTVHPDIVGMKVKEVVALGRFPYVNMFGTLSRHDKDMINHSLEVLGVQYIKNYYYSDLSDGQKQKVMIARAVAQDTSIIVLDEPTTYLDYVGRFEVIALLNKLVETENKAIVFSSHDWDLILGSVKKVWAFSDDNGFLVESPEDIIKKNMFNSIFPGINNDIVQGFRDKIDA